MNWIIFRDLNPILKILKTILISATAHSTLEKEHCLTNNMKDTEKTEEAINNV